MHLPDVDVGGHDLVREIAMDRTGFAEHDRRSNRLPT